MGGTSKSQSQSSQQSQLNPYAPASAGLQGILSGLQPSVNDLGVSPLTNQAFGQIEANAQQPNPFAAPATSAALTQLQGGPNIPAATGILNSNYGQVQGALSPYTSGSALNPASNPALAQELGTVGQQVSDSVNPLFSAAGRLGSPDNAKALALGITQGSTPLLQSAATNELAATGQLAAAGGATAGGLTNADIANAGILGQGINNATNAYNVNNLSPQTLLAASMAQGQLPIQNAGLLSSIYGPIAAQFGQQTGSGTQSGTQTMSGAQQFATIANGINNLFGAFKQGGSAGSFPSFPS